MLEKALNIAIKAHSGQFRKNIIKIPYVMHPVAVVNFLMSCGESDPKVLAVAMLHDAIEDANDRAEMTDLIRKELGNEIVDPVLELTLPEEASGKVAYGQLASSKKEAKYKHIGEQMLNGSLISKKVKIADRYINVMDYVLAKEEKYASKYLDMFMGACKKFNVPAFSEVLDYSNFEDKVYYQLVCKIHELKERFHS